MRCTYDGSEGIPELDERRRLMLVRLAFLRKTLAEGGNWNDMHSALSMLVKDFEICFTVEEVLMRIHDYPEYDRHKNDHADLLRSLHTLERAILTNGLTEQMIGDAFEAMINHHLIQDWRCNRYLPLVGARA